MHHKRARSWIPAIAVALIAAIAVAACGNSSTTGSKTSTSSSSAAASGSTSRTKLAACLKQHGITLPSRPVGAKPPSGGYGGGGHGGAGGGYGGGGGFFGGGAGGPGGAKGAQSSKFRAAFKACGADFGGGGRYARGGAGGFKPSAAALSKFSACVDQHGYKLPKPNTSGHGSIFPKSIESNKKFEAAAKACSSDLRPSGGGSSSSGSTGSSD
jgi:hypothetical protein